MLGRGRCWFLLATAFASAFVVPSACAQDVPDVIDREYEIKAAYLYNFGLYVEWPKEWAPGDSKEFVIGILGKDPFGVNLAKIAVDKKVNGKAIVVHVFKSIKDYKPCHMLFISGGGEKEESAGARLAAALKKIKDDPVLVVCETAGLAKKGAVINFLIEENTVHFEINTDLAKNANLQISSKLLRLGKKIVKE
jgi:hypothetical protein